MAANNNVSGWVGWVYFAGIVMVVSGFFEAIAGLTAIFNSDFFVVTSSHLAVFNITSWGWIHLALGALVLTAGLSVMTGAVWARVIGVICTVLALLANMTWVNAYPVWSIMAITIDFLVLYALLVHGNEAKTA